MQFIIFIYYYQNIIKGLGLFRTYIDRGDTDIYIYIYIVYISVRGGYNAAAVVFQLAITLMNTHEYPRMISSSREFYTLCTTVPQTAIRPMLSPILLNASRICSRFNISIEK